ncbi:5-methylcytosine restriction system specificity protein McrC [Cellulosimicrobium sp. AB352]|uniref:5-methylcytosine restriction system specificity protein McrC n=1 Tax=Cellulosimicrobium sp. AB352 TaxID=3413281 RepID=UPI003C18BF87
MTTDTGLVVRSAREYGEVDLEPSDILDADGNLLVLEWVRDRYVTASFRKGRPYIQALGVCGVFPLTDRVIVHVQPRFPSENMTRMVNACGYVPTAIRAFRTYGVDEEASAWISDTLADSFLDTLDVIRQRGLMKEYVRESESSSFPHGRIDSTKTMQRLASRGIKHRAAYSWWERSADITVNRCLRAALRKLHARYDRTSGPGQRRQRRQFAKGERHRMARIASGMSLLRYVQDDPNHMCLRDRRVRGLQELPEPRSYYRAALDLAVAILMDRGVDLDRPGATLRLPSVVINSETLFEEYIRTSLKDRFADLGVEVVDGNQAEGHLPLYTEPTAAMTGLVPEAPAWKETPAKTQPDVLFRDFRGRVPLVADVKYTLVTDSAKRASVEQVILYAVRYGCRVAMTIHPRPHGGEAGLRVSGRIGDVLVLQYRIDLSALDFAEETERMVSSFRRLLANSLSILRGIH